MKIPLYTIVNLLVILARHFQIGFWGWAQPSHAFRIPARHRKVAGALGCTAQLKPSLCSALTMAFYVPLLAAAPVHEYWIGSYEMTLDSSKGRLVITYSEPNCGGPASCMAILYYDFKGEKSVGYIERIDHDGYHMVFQLDVPSKMVFEAYLFRSDNTRMVGVTRWGKNVAGFYAAKRDKSAAAIPSAMECRILPDGTIVTRYPDGTVRHNQAEAKIAGDESGKQKSKGRSNPEGQERSTVKIGVQKLMPPDPPLGSSEYSWLEDQSNRLLQIIQGLVGNDQTSMDNFFRAETERGYNSMAQKIDWRTGLILGMVRP